MMKESSTSLRWYFGIVGVLYFLGTGFVFLLLRSSLSALASAPVFSTPLTAFNTILNFVWALGYLYFAFTLPKYLNPERVKYVKIFLLVPFAEMVLWSAWEYFTLGQVSYIYLIGSALFTWYLYANVQRLAVPPTKIA